MVGVNGTRRSTGKKQRRHWRKLHLGVDAHGWIHAVEVTEDHEQDPSQVPGLLGQLEREVRRFVGDGIYDQEPVYELVKKHSPGAVVIVPPRKHAAVSGGDRSSPSQRDRHILRIQEIGRPKWRRESGYYRQSHAENAMHRYKATFGARIRAKNMAAQEREVGLGCAILNRIRGMGRPVYCPAC